jgi:hypothetical protein
VRLRPAAYSGDFMFGVRVKSLLDENDSSKALHIGLSMAEIYFTIGELPVPFMWDKDGDFADHSASEIYVGPNLSLLLS